MQNCFPLVQRFSNVVPQDNVRQIEFLMLDSLYFPWYLQKKTSSKTSSADDYMDSWPDTPQLTHNFIFDSEENSSFTDRVLKLMDWNCIKQTIGFNGTIRRMKGNLLLQSSNTTPNIPHYDLDSTHTALLYYINDSDGDTVFFDRTYGDKKPIDSTINIIRQETPAAGDFIVFDGSICHASSNPILYQRRAVINFTLIQ